MRDYRKADDAFRLQTILEGTQAATWEWNVQTGETRFNERWAELLGYALAELEPVSIETWQQFAHPDDLELSAAALERHFSGQAPFYEVEVRMRHRDGHWVWVRDYGRIVTRTPCGQPEWISGSHIDISAIKHQHARLKATHQQMEGLLRRVPAVVYQFQRFPDGRSCFPYASQGTHQVYGIAPEDIAADASIVFAQIHPGDRQQVEQSIAHSAATLTQWRAEYRISRDAVTYWVQGDAQPEALPDGSVLWHGIITDITERKELELELARNRDILHRAQQIGRLGHWEANLNTGNLVWSDIVHEIFGVDPTTFEPSVDYFKRMVHPEDLPRVEASEARAAETGIHDVEHRILRPDGSIRWVHELAEMDPGASKGVLVGTVRDITDHKELVAQLHRQSITDELTRAYNRRHFMEVLDREFSRFKRYRTHCSVATFDFDHFKQINDTYGHAGGDAVLREISALIRKRLRGSDILARLGGEEFSLILPETTAADATQFAEQLREQIASQQFHHDICSFTCTASFGVAEFDPDDPTLDAILKRADNALYQAKASGRNRVCMLVNPGVR